MKKTMSKFALGLIFTSVSLAHAEFAPDYSIQHQYQSVRALGMGGAFVAVADDHSAILYNPAGLAFRKDGNMHFSLGGSLNQDLVGFSEKVDQKSKETNSEQAISDLIETSYGDAYQVRFPLGAFWVRPNWGIAFIPVDLSVNVSLHRMLGPQVNVNAYMDTTFAYGYARKVPWLGKKWATSVGVTGKAIHRVQASKSLIASELTQDSEIVRDEDAREGLTVDADIGFMTTPTIPKNGFWSFLKYTKPTFGLVVRNLVDHGFSTNLHLVNKKSQEPEKLQRRFDLGTRWDLPQFWVISPKVVFDIADMGHKNFSLRKGIHAGTEFSWEMFNWWKGHWSAGINQGYWTAGIGARLAWFMMQISSYGEEVGVGDLKSESRNYILELSLDF